MDGGREGTITAPVGKEVAMRALVLIAAVLGCSQVPEAETHGAAEAKAGAPEAKAGALKAEAGAQEAKAGAQEARTGASEAKAGATEAKAGALEAKAGATTWSFDGDAEGSPPAGFTFGRTGQGGIGKWVVRGAKDAPSGSRVLAQVDADDTDFRFPLALVDASYLSDLRLSVRCRMVAGTVDRAAGLAFRCRDENNYYVVRANALENNVILFVVKDGSRFALTEWDGPVAAGTWHDLGVEARGSAIRVSWDGKPVLDTSDATFPGPGRVGLWTKADSVTEFDDLALEAL
jgi:hypothetical protein